MNSHLIAVSAAALLVSACTTEYPLGIAPQSNFTYPRSLVTPISNVTASTTEASFGGIVIPTGKMKQATIDAALGQVSNANVLLNYHETITITNLAVLPIFTLTYSIDGIAAEAEVQ